MKKIAKILAMFAIFALAFSFAGCKSDDSDSSDDDVTISGGSTSGNGSSNGSSSGSNTSGGGIAEMHRIILLEAVQAVEVIQVILLELVLKAAIPAVQVLEAVSRLQRALLKFLPLLLTEQKAGSQIQKCL